MRCACDVCACDVCVCACARVVCALRVWCVVCVCVWYVWYACGVRRVFSARVLVRVCGVRACVYAGHVEGADSNPTVLFSRDNLMTNIQ